MTEIELVFEELCVGPSSAPESGDGDVDVDDNFDDEDDAIGVYPCILRDSSVCIEVATLVVTS